MKKSCLLMVVFTAFLSIFTMSSHAALYPILGNQAVVDFDLDITWIADANLAATNTFGLSTNVSLGTHPNDTASPGNNGIIYSSGLMNWTGALFYIDAMNANNYLGYSDWRLAYTPFNDSTCNDAGGSPASNSTGWDCTGGEGGHLFYSEFGATRMTSVLSTGNSTELAKFSNLDSIFWEDSNLTPYRFWLTDGGQAPPFDIYSDVARIWPVRDGGIAAVPVPPAFWLFCSGLLGLIGVSRRKKTA